MDYHKNIRDSLMDLRYPEGISETNLNAFTIDSKNTKYDEKLHNCIQIQTTVTSHDKTKDDLQRIQYSIPSLADYITKFKLNGVASRVEFVVCGIPLNIIFDPKPGVWYDLYPVPVNNLAVQYGTRFLNIEGDVRSVDMIYLLCNRESEKQARELGIVVHKK